MYYLSISMLHLSSYWNFYCKCFSLTDVNSFHSNVHFITKECEINRNKGSLRPPLLYDALFLYLLNILPLNFCVSNPVNLYQHQSLLRLDWNSLPADCFPLTHNLNNFKTNVNRHLVYLVIAWTLYFLLFSFCNSILENGCLILYGVKVIVCSVDGRIPIVRSKVTGCWVLMNFSIFWY